METFLFVLAIAILILIAYLVLINQKILKKVVTYKRDAEKLKISDERYYELNNKIQLIISVSSIIILIGGFIGYNSINNIYEEIGDDLNQYRNKIENYESVIFQYESLIDQLEIERKNISEVLKASISETDQLQSALVQLQKDYRFNVKTYMVSNIKIEKKKIEGTNDYERIRVYYEDLKNIDGKKLPKFESPPFINIQNIGFAFIVKIVEITTEYFEYDYGEMNLYDPETGKEESLFPISTFDILITVNM